MYMEDSASPLLITLAGEAARGEGEGIRRVGGDSQGGFPRERKGERSTIFDMHT
jgi:hypothetical protein